MCIKDLKKQKAGMLCAIVSRGYQQKQDQSFLENIVEINRTKQ